MRKNVLSQKPDSSNMLTSFISTFTVELSCLCFSGRFTASQLICAFSAVLDGFRRPCLHSLLFLSR